MSYPNSGSFLQSSVNSSLTTQIVVKVNRATVGAIQQLTINQNRDMNVFEECGTDGIVEIVPKGATRVDLTIHRTVFDQLRITEAFSRGFINIQAQRIPFNIEIISRDTNDPATMLVFILSNCWFKSCSMPHDANNYLIVEQAGVVCERITAMRGSESAVFGGLRGITYEKDSIDCPWYPRNRGSRACDHSDDT